MLTVAKVIADSISPIGIRLTTLELVFPRFLLAELNTHRVFSRNSASSRAIPVQKMIDQVLQNPATPTFWGKNQSGMSAREELQGEDKEACIQEWMLARHDAISHVEKMMKRGLHKQIANRLLEPWMLTHTILTSTEWNNFFKLRCHPDAQPEFKVLAESMKDALIHSKPIPLQVGEWHLPYIKEYLDTPETRKYSVARCARVSYKTHENQNPDLAKDLALHDKLLESGHFSPFEHQATPKTESRFFANYFSWQSQRNQLGF